jgi:hypothetical protein
MDAQPAIVAFSGHMTDAPDRASARFPEQAVPKVRESVRRALAARGSKLVGVSSAARGGDLIFLSEVLLLGGTATVLLPFPPGDFKATSVGQGWDSIFDDVIGSPQIQLISPLRDQLPEIASDRDAAYEACNVAIIDTAERLAREYGDSDPLFLAVYARTETDKQGGTAHAFSRWTERGHRLQFVDPTE